MSTNKRIPKRSIIGARVSVGCEDGLWRQGKVTSMRTSELETNKMFSVKMDVSSQTQEWRETEIYGPGFMTSLPCNTELVVGQAVFVTHNGREVEGNVVLHLSSQDCVQVDVKDSGLITKRLEDIRLLESRKSARLVNTDTDFSLLADFNIVEQRKLAQERSGQPPVSSRRRLHSMSDFLDRKRQKNAEKDRREAKRRQRSERQRGPASSSTSSSSSIEVPLSFSLFSGSRKRRTSESRAEIDSGYGSSFGSGFFKTNEENLKECTAAMVLMNLSVSPRDKWTDPASYFTSSGSGSDTSPPITPRPSPAPSLSHIHLSEDEEPYKRSRPSPCSLLYQCTWRGCSHTETCQTEMERHVRRHLALPDPPPGTDYAGEEDFYYTELEVEEMTDTSMDILTEIDSGCSSSSNDGLEYCYQLNSPTPTTSAVTENKKKTKENFIKILPNTNSPTSLASSSSSSSSVPSNFEFGMSHPLGDHIGMVRPSYEAPTTIYVVNTVPSPTKDHMYNSTQQQSWQGKKLVSIVPRPSDPHKPTDLLTSDQSPFVFKSSPSGMKSDKKCRKVYGIDQKDLWCTQCKWKKACGRFT